MKYNNYSLVIANTLLFITIFIMIITFSFTYKISIYKNYKIINYNKNTYQIILSDTELKDFYKTNFIYINNKKYTYRIDRVNKKILVKDNKNYNEVFININNTNYKTNDIIDVSILKKKIPIIKIFKSIYK